MKLTKKLALTTLMISFALALIGCDGDNGGDTPDGNTDEDIVEKDMGQEPDCDNPYFCVAQDTKQPDQKDSELEIEETIPEIEEPMPEIFLWWKANWECTSLETCWVLDDPKIMTLEVGSWDAENQVAHFYGLTPCVNWEIRHDGTSFQMTGYTQDGSITCQLEVVNGNLITIYEIVNGTQGSKPWIWEHQ